MAVCLHGFVHGILPVPCKYRVRCSGIWIYCNQELDTWGLSSDWRKAYFKSDQAIWQRLYTSMKNSNNNQLIYYTLCWIHWGFSPCKEKTVFIIKRNIILLFKAKGTLFFACFYRLVQLQMAGLDSQAPSVISFGKSSGLILPGFCQPNQDMISTFVSIFSSSFAE